MARFLISKDTHCIAIIYNELRVGTNTAVALSYVAMVRRSQILIHSRLALPARKALYLEILGIELYDVGFVPLILTQVQEDLLTPVKVDLFINLTISQKISAWEIKKWLFRNLLED